MVSRKLAAGILAALMATSVFAGCGDENKATTSQPQKQEQKAEAPSKIDVTLDPQVKHEGNNVVLEATTNLPDGTEVTLTLTNRYTKLVEMGYDENFEPGKLPEDKAAVWKNTTYNFSQKVAVTNGKLTTKAFPADQLKPGKAELSATMVLPSLQPEDVKAKIGARGENLTGSLFKNNNVAVEKKVDIQ